MKKVVNATFAIHNRTAQNHPPLLPRRRPRSSERPNRNSRKRKLATSADQPHQRLRLSRGGAPRARVTHEESGQRHLRHPQSHRTKPSSPLTSTPATFQRTTQPEFAKTKAGHLGRSTPPAAQALSWRRASRARDP